MPSLARGRFGEKDAIKIHIIALSIRTLKSCYRPRELLRATGLIGSTVSTYGPLWGTTVLYHAVVRDYALPWGGCLKRILWFLALRIARR